MRLSAMRGALFVLPAMISVLAGCPKDDPEPATASEALSAVDESSADSQASALAASSIELDTHFTIGQAVEAAASDLRAFYAAEIPCAQLALSGATLTVDYGAKGTCLYKGQAFTGQASITVTRNADGGVEVDHAWNAFSNGRVSVTGTANVTWSGGAAASRHVVHDLRWTRLSDGRTGEGKGDRTQTPLAGGVTEGIEENGTRSWTGAAGTWDLGIDGVQIRWVDPVPQAGSFTLRTPKGKALSLSFARVDADTIRVTVASGARSFAFDVNAVGAIAQKS